MRRAFELMRGTLLRLGALTGTDMIYLAKGGFWLTLGHVISMTSALALAIAFGHLATQDTYGNYKYALTLASLVGMFTLSDLGTAITQAVARGSDGALRQGFFLNLKWSIGAMLIALVGAGYFTFVDNNPFLSVSLVIIAAFSPLISGFGLYDPFLIGKKLFRQEALYFGLGVAFVSACMAGMLLFTDRAIVLVATYFIASSIAVAVPYLLSLRHVRNNDTDAGLLRYGTHLSIMSALGTLTDKIDNLIIFSFLGPTQLAIYSYAIAIPEQIKALVKMVVPLSIGKFAERTIAEIAETIWRKLSLFAFGFTVIILAYMTAAYWVFQILFPVYMDSIGFSIVYALSIICTTISIPLNTVLQAHRQTRALYIISNVSSGVLLISLPYLVFIFGIWGAIASQILYRVVGMLLTLWQFGVVQRAQKVG